LARGRAACLERVCLGCPVFSNRIPGPPTLPIFRNIEQMANIEKLMRITMRPVADIHPYEGNPRANDAAVDAVARSIQEFGFRQPIVVDEQDVS